MSDLPKWKRDVIVGILLEAFCAVAFITSFSIPVGTMGKIKAAQPGVYLRMWLVVFAVLSLALIINAVWKKDKTEVQPMFQFQTVFTLAVLAGYIYIMKTLGFLVSTILFCVIIILEYSLAAGKFKDAEGNPVKGAALAKSIGFYLIIAVIISVATDFIFRNLLNVLLPTWSL